MSAAGITRILHATAFAVDAHDSRLCVTRRRNGPACIKRMLAAAEILSDYTDNVDTIVAILLHYTCASTDVTLNEIERTFGRTVAGLVAEVVDDDSLCEVDRRRAQVARIPAMSADARLIKLVNIAHTLPQSWLRARIQGYAAWSRKKYISGLAGLVPMLDDHLDDIFKNAMVCAYCERYPLLVVDDRHLDAAVEAFYAMLKD